MDHGQLLVLVEGLAYMFVFVVGLVCGLAFARLLDPSGGR